MGVVGDRLQESSTTGLTPIQPHSLCLLLIVLEDKSKRRKDERLDDSKRTIRPTPARHVDKRLSRPRTNKSSADKGRASKGERKSTVPQTGGISDENLQDQINCIVSNPVQHVTGGVRVGVVAGGQDNQTQNVDTDEHQVTLGTTPDVDSFGDGEFQHTTDDTVQDVGGTDLGRGGEAAVGFVDDVAVDGGVEGQHEETDPDPVPVSLVHYHRRRWPR